MDYSRISNNKQPQRIIYDNYKFEIDYKPELINIDIIIFSLTTLNAYTCNITKINIDKLYTELIQTLSSRQCNFELKYPNLVCTLSNNEQIILYFNELITMHKKQDFLFDKIKELEITIKTQSDEIKIFKEKLLKSEEIIFATCFYTGKKIKVPNDIPFDIEELDLRQYNEYDFSKNFCNIFPNLRKIIIYAHMSDYILDRNLDKVNHGWYLKEIYVDISIYKCDKDHEKMYNYKTSSKNYRLEPKYLDIDYLSTTLTKINFIINKIEDIDNSIFRLHNMQNTLFQIIKSQNKEKKDYRIKTIELIINKTNKNVVQYKSRCQQYFPNQELIIKLI